MSITIIDFNDNEPIVEPVLFPASVAENSPNDTATSGRIQILDLDVEDRFSQFSVSLNNFNDVFYISPTSGTSFLTARIYVKNNNLLDYERGPRSYAVVIVAQERGTDQRFRHSATATIRAKQPVVTSITLVSLQVLDVNDNAPYFDRPRYNFGVNENAEPGTVIARLQVSANITTILVQFSQIITLCLKDATGTLMLNGPSVSCRRKTETADALGRPVSGTN